MFVTILALALAAGPGSLRAQTNSVAVERVSMLPGSGTVTSSPGVVIRGTVTGDDGPFLVTFLVDGFVESSLSGLAAGTTFAHTLTLPGEGAHTLAVRATSSGGTTAGPTTLGSVTLDRTPPAQPIITTPAPTGPIVTSSDSIVIAGVVPGASGSTTGTYRVFVRGAPGMHVSPTQPQDVTEPTGAFSSTVDLSALPDGSYTIEVFSLDPAGNWSAPALRLQVGASPSAPKTSPRPYRDAANHIDSLLMQKPATSTTVLERASQVFRRWDRRQTFERLHHDSGR